MIISIIVAMSRDGLIGRRGGLPWHLPRDLKRFRNLTMGKPILMGRTTYESLGKPLDGRLNIVLTRQGSVLPHPDLRVARSYPEAVEIADEWLAQMGGEEMFVIGGASVYQEAMPRVDRAYLTLVEGDFEGDTYFPTGLLDRGSWTVIEESVHPADSRNPHGVRFRTLNRLHPAAENR